MHKKPVLTRQQLEDLRDLINACLNDMDQGGEQRLSSKGAETMPDWLRIEAFLRIHEFPNYADALAAVKDHFDNPKINETHIIAIRKKLGQRGRPGRNKAPDIVHLKGNAAPIK